LIKSQATQIPGVLIVEPESFGDDRGFFLESFNEREMRSIGIDAHFVQDNHSRSQCNVLRGLHYQVSQPQGKLVRVVTGRVFDVAVDVRRYSAAFGKWVGVELSAENKRMFWLPAGMAHGFVVLSDFADFLYKATEYYAPQFERTILWNDPDLSIEWPLAGQPILSAKDLVAKNCDEAEVFEKECLLKGANAEH
jgi:dTDP-4-dehydrorhamnose 3,5-epimerase